MYDAEKELLIFKNNEERDEFVSKCEKVFVNEYYHVQNSFDKWKKDGERFLNENFLNSQDFPYLNDGRIELIEWVFYSLFTHLNLGNWDYDCRLVEAADFLKNMSNFSP